MPEMAATPARDAVADATLPAWWRPEMFHRDAWDLTAAGMPASCHPTRARTNFARISDPYWRQIAKEFVWARLFVDVHGTARLVPHDLCLEVVKFKTLYRWATDDTLQPPGPRLRLGTMTPDDFGRYVNALKNGDLGFLSQGTIHGYARLIDRLYEYRPYLSDQLQMPPFGHGGAQRVAPSPPRDENTTPRIPLEVLSPFIRWALFYVQTAATDILAAEQEVEALREHSHLLAGQRPQQLLKLADEFDRRRALGRGVPIWEPGKGRKVTGTPNLALLWAKAGCGDVKNSRFPEGRALVAAALAELGPEVGGLDTEITVDPTTGRPWRPRFGLMSAWQELVHLRAACYVVVAYLSGMRDSEIKEIRPGAATFAASVDGMVERHRVASLVVKGRTTPEPATWVVAPQVPIALDVAERIDGAERVFDRMRYRIDSIQAFAAHVNDLAGDSTELQIPLVDDHEWRFDTRQFRRTLAWFIGSQPFGIWAGAAQFKHRSVEGALRGIGATVFEGYMGSTPSGFPTEVQQAAQAAADLYVNELVDRHTGGAASGGRGARRINSELERLRRDLDTHDQEQHAEPQVVDTARRTAMLRSVSHNLFVGPLTDCFFDASKALCVHENDRPGALRPTQGRCQPTACHNSRIGEQHLPEWEQRLSAVRTDLKTRGLPAIQREHLARQRDDLKSAIDTVRRTKETEQ